MTSLEHRQNLVALIQAACCAGARLAPACKVAGLSLRTLQRWLDEQGQPREDARPKAQRSLPHNALSPGERQAFLSVANEARFAALPPARIVPALADEGRYLGSESTLHRILKAEGQNQHRGRARAPRARKTPTTHVATAPGQLWAWDMTYLLTPTKGRFLHLYVILDLFSRKILGWSVHQADHSDHVVALLKRTALAEGLPGMAHKPILHGDNGATFKAGTVLALLQNLGIQPSHSRPRVSNDNAHVEAFFRTAKYRPEFPSRGFAEKTEAEAWARAFVHWYNEEHLHRGIRYVSPAQRHAGQDVAILAKRHELYQEARASHPERWSGSTRNWAPVQAVTLNPERQAVVAKVLKGPQLDEVAA